MNDLCETCGRVDTHLVLGMCRVCQAKHVPSILTADRLLAVMSRHIGAERGATVSQLADEMFWPAGVRDDMRNSVERNLRDLVVQLRMAGHHVCAHPSSGYYMAASADELDATCTFLFDRAMTSLSQVAAMKRVSLPDLRGQLQLPT